MTPDERREAIASRRQPAGRTERRWVQGQFELFEVYRVPTDLLILNGFYCDPIVVVYLLTLRPTT